MKLLSLFFIAMLFIVVAGCDGDGDGDGTATPTETTNEENGTVEEPTGPETVVTDSKTVAPTEGRTFPFNIYETGVIEARVEWSSGPSKLDILLCHDSLVCVSQPSIQSPAILQMQATQDLLDNSNVWGVIVNNDSFIEEVTVDCTVTFTPD